MNAIFHRVSIRKYEDRPVEQEKIELTDVSDNTTNKIFLLSVSEAVLLYSSM